MGYTTEKDRGDIKVIEDGGSVMLFVATSQTGKEWLDDNITEDAFRIGERGLVVEHRYVLPLVRVMKDDGLRIITAWN
ncbi:hypothetical protein UFOVP357_46 [uncultured Caudovirales phage]|jgi:hypothetical protein|uniref:Uncharacterized protein n=1 Tax=uncultured Caudovirales phage TaxID=2100421 RepID=A0A6J7WT39_9CAUD|nr:hypothetical protein UFOVP357_46 [uncultured Caudovirales phage]